MEGKAWCGDAPRSLCPLPRRQGGHGGLRRAEGSTGRGRRSAAGLVRALGSASPRRDEGQPPAGGASSPLSEWSQREEDECSASRITKTQLLGSHCSAGTPRASLQGGATRSAQPGLAAERARLTRGPVRWPLEEARLQEHRHLDQSPVSGGPCGSSLVRNQTMGERGGGAVGLARTLFLLLPVLPHPSSLPGLHPTCGRRGSVTAHTGLSTLTSG